MLLLMSQKGITPIQKVVLRAWAEDLKVRLIAPMICLGGFSTVPTSSGDIDTRELLLSSAVSCMCIAYTKRCENAMMHEGSEPLLRLRKFAMFA